MAEWNLLNLNSAAKAYNQNWQNMNNQIEYFKNVYDQMQWDAIDAWQEINHFNYMQALENRNWQAQQADINRNFQAYMSATAHQREVEDLRKAGLSPVLSANAGASTPAGSMPSGAQATADNSLVNVYANMAGSAMNAVNNLSTAMGNMSSQLVTNVNSANVAKYGSELQADVNYYATKIQSWTSQEVARIAYNAGVTQAEIHAAAQKYSAALAYDASVFASRLGYNATMEQINAAIRNTDATNLTSYNIAKANNDVADANGWKSMFAGIVGGLLHAIP